MSTRKVTLNQLATEPFDALILGGGINGAVSAAALAAQGAKVALIDRGDFAIGSSSQSSNLAWGGIKYMESGELLLVQKLCRSRNHLMDNYPSRVKEIRFFTTIKRGFRWPAWIIFCGAVLYWLMGACRTQPPRFLSRRDIEREQPLIDAAAIAGGVEYSDCYLPGNDARFVFNFIRSAIDNGAVVTNYVEALGSHRDIDGTWVTNGRDRINGQQLTIKAKVLVNACGPYVDGYNKNIGQLTQYQHVFSKGVHLIVPRLIAEEKILAFFASDGRLFFVIPMGDCTCIGTTDTPEQDPAVEVSEDDRRFILDNANQLLRLQKPLTREDIIAERCGVRPLVVKRGKNAQVDWLKLSRKHKIHNNRRDHYLSIFGGKITDCINVGDEVVEHCRQFGILPAKEWQKWYGEPDQARKQQFMATATGYKLDRFEPDSSGGEGVAERWWRRFGERAYVLLEQVKKDPTVLQRPLPECDYSYCEIALMGQEECITTLDDFLRRRTKIALMVPTTQLVNHPGLVEVAELLFGKETAGDKLHDYLQRVVGGEPPIVNKVVGA